MALNTFLDFSTTAASNIDVAGIGIQGTNPVSNFDNGLRQLMAILRRDLDNGMVFTSKSANYTAVANDNNAFIRFSAAATLSLTAAATLGADWHCWVVADGGAVVIDPNSSETINGATTITIPDGYSTLVICDGTNFRALEDYSQFAAKADAVQATVDVASATTTDIGAAASWNIRITGTTTITGLGTVAEGTLRFVRMAGALTLTHNGTSLILPGAANITTAANDCFLARSLGSGNWIVLFYQRSVPPVTASGDAPTFAPRAWVNFNGTGTVAIRASGNVSSITDHGTGEYTVNFTTAMPDANYVVNVTAFNSGSSAIFLAATTTFSQTTSSFRFAVRNQSATLVDAEYIFVTVLR